MTTVKIHRSSLESPQEILLSDKPIEWSREWFQARLQLDPEFELVQRLLVTFHLSMQPSTTVSLIDAFMDAQDISTFSVQCKHDDLYLNVPIEKPISNLDKFGETVALAEKSGLVMRIPSMDARIGRRSQPFYVRDSSGQMIDGIPHRLLLRERPRKGDLIACHRLRVEAVEGNCITATEVPHPRREYLVRSLTGQCISLDLNPFCIIADVKNAYQEKADVPPEQMQLLFSGIPLDDDVTLAEYNVPWGSTIHGALKLRGGMMHPSSSVLGVDSSTDREPLRSNQLHVIDATGAELTLPVSGDTCMAQVLKAIASVRSVGASKAVGRACPVSDARWKVLLERERDLRVSEQVQRRMHDAESTYDREWMDVAAEVQTQVLNESPDILAAFRGDAGLALQAFRSAALKFPEIAIQVKWNRARRGFGMIGSLVSEKWLPLNSDLVPVPDPFGRTEFALVVAGSLS